MSDTHYYAVPDPRDGTMTYWREDKRGRLTAWPTTVRYGPVLLAADVPSELAGKQRDAWISAWFCEHAYPWHDAIRAAITAAPDRCRARFASFTSRCCFCGRELTDPASKVYGIGPDCRHGLSDAVLSAMAREMGRVHLDVLDEGGGCSR